MMAIKPRIVEFVDYVDKTYKNEEVIFPDFQKSEESKIQAEKKLKIQEMINLKL